MTLLCPQVVGDGQIGYIYPGSSVVLPKGERSSLSLGVLGAALKALLTWRFRLQSLVTDAIPVFSSCAHRCCSGHHRHRRVQVRSHIFHSEVAVSQIDLSQ